MIKVITSLLFDKESSLFPKTPRPMLTLTGQGFGKESKVSKYAIVFDVRDRHHGEPVIAGIIGAQLVRNLNTKVKCLPAYKDVLQSEIHWFTRNMTPQDHLFLHVLSDCEPVVDARGEYIEARDLGTWASRFQYSLNLWTLLDFPNSVRYLPQDFDHVFYCDTDMQVKKRASAGETHHRSRRAFCCIIAVDTCDQSSDFSLSDEFASVLQICRGRVTLLTLIKALACRLRSAHVTPVLCCNRAVPLERTFFYFG